MLEANQELSATTEKQRYQKVFFNYKYIDFHIPETIVSVLENLAALLHYEITVHNKMWQSENSAVFRRALDNLKTSRVIDIILLI